MARTALIHVGDQKAGSKTIQRFIAENAAELEARGYRRNRTYLCGNYHSGLTACALEPGRNQSVELREWGIGDDVGIAEDQATVRAQLDARMGEEMAALPPGVHTVLFSHEGLLMSSAEEVARVAGMLRPHFERIVAVAYLRRQDRTAVSAYSTRLRSAHRLAERPPSLKLLRDPPPLRDYAAALDAWAAAIGEESVRPRIFHRDDFVGGELLSDFLAAAELGAPEGFAPIPPQNEAISPAAQAFLTAMNPHLPGIVDGERNPRRALLLNMLSEIASGRGQMPSRIGARRYYKRHGKINEAVRKRWFPERKRLFDEEFGEYPLWGERALSYADTAGLVASLVSVYGDRLRKCQAETAMARGELLRLQERHAEARVMFERGAQMRPEDAAPHLGLARTALAEGDLNAAALEIAEAEARQPELPGVQDLKERLRARLAERDADASPTGCAGALAETAEA